MDNSWLSRDDSGMRGIMIVECIHGGRALGSILGPHRRNWT